MKNVSRIFISRKHLKSFQNNRCYDGMKKYKKAAKSEEILRLSATILFDIYNTEKYKES